MKTLLWIVRSVAAVLLGLGVKWLWSSFDSLPAFYYAYPIEILLAILAVILLIIVLYSFEIGLHGKAKLEEAFEVFKPVRRLNPADFRITNYRPFYIQRESDREIESLLKERKYVFITGIPMIGKTRMAYEAAKKLKGFYLLKPKYERIDIKKLKLSFFRNKVVLFLDDLDKYVGKFDVDDLITKLKKESKDFVLIATCRAGKEFDQVFARKEMETLITQCQKGKTEPRTVTKDEERKLATAVGRRLQGIPHDGTPGSITIDLRYMKERYDQLGHEKSILKSLKLLREGNIFLWKENLVKEVSNTIFDLSVERTTWDGHLRSLFRNGFINTFSERIPIAHDVYLDNRFMDDYSVKDDDLKKLKTLFHRTLRDAESLFYLGNSLWDRKNLSEAEDCYAKSLKLNWNDAEVHYNLGLLLDELKRYGEAEKEYRSALRINPLDADAHYNLGLLLDALERYDEAEKEYKEALRINPDYAEVRCNLGTLLDGLKRYDEAEKEYKEALRIKADDAEVHYNLGILLDGLRRHDEAEKEYRQALRINPDDAEVHYNLGILLDGLRRHDEAEKEYKESLRINPDDAEVHYTLGLLFEELERYDEAEKEYKESLRINPDDAEVNYTQGLLLDGLERYDEAEKEYKAALRINPDDAEVHYNLGILLDGLKRYDEAEKEYKESLRINPDDPEAHNNLGNLLDGLKRYDEAEKEYREALRINPDYAEVHYNFGILLADLNRKGQAKKQFEIAVDLFRKQREEKEAQEAEELLKDL
jgi:tetratricopeptide (TPR) repeat protein